MPTDLLRTAGVLGAVKQEDFAVLYDRRRIEGGIGFPRHCGVRRDDRIDLGGLCKGTEHPRLLRVPALHGEQQSKARSHKLGAPARRADRNPAAATARSSSQDTAGTAT